MDRVTVGGTTAHEATPGTAAPGQAAGPVGGRAALRRATVLVTGASTGIGAATAVHLTRLGFTVLAGVRRDADAERISRAAPDILPVQLDVTDPQAIAEVVRTVDSLASDGISDGRAYDRENPDSMAGDRAPGGELVGLVNNAGIAVVGPVESLTLADWRRQLEVNLLGSIAVTTALLPALLRARGRIVNISSICGRIALPLFGPYSVSKFGLEAFTDTLRREVGPYGVKVVSVEPGAIATPIWDKGRVDSDTRLDNLLPTVRQRYAGTVGVAQRLAAAAAGGGLPAGAVAEVIGRALTAPSPRTRYVVGTVARVQIALARLLPDRTTDLLIGRWLRAR